MLSDATSSIQPVRRMPVDPAVARDADRLFGAYGEHAVRAAALAAWREDAGLLYSAVPGHWERVRLELAQRRSGAGTTRDGSARIQALHLT